MDLPKVAAKAPVAVSLEAGKTYAYCTCGLSDNQPFCNGAHRGTEYTPNKFTAEETQTAYFCQCKQTGNTLGRCDGSHKGI